MAEAISEPLCQEVMQDDIESGRNAEGLQADQKSFPQHDDPDVVIPDHIARSLVYSSHLLLVTAIVSLVYGDYGIFVVLFVVYATSIWHWHKPRFSSIARRADFSAVAIAIVYGSVYAATKSSTSLIIAWFVGLAVIGCVFVTNEVSIREYALNS